MNELVVGTDFTGLGSFEEALKRLKVKHRIAFACDKDKYVKQSYLANHTPEIFYDDIVLRDQAKTPYSDIYCFGFPCQAFSLAGNRKGFEDTRGTLFFNSLEYIRKNKPNCFLAENVKGLLSHDKGRTFSVIKDALGYTINGQHNLYKYDDCVNYHIHYLVINSKKHGIPQNRERIFIVGFKDHVNFKFPKPIDLKIKFKDLLEDEVDEKYFISEKLTKWILSHREKRDSQNEFPIDREKRDVIPTINARYYKTGAEDIYILEPNMLSLKRNEKGKKIRKAYEAGLIKEKRQNIQDLLPRTDGISNTITTGVNKENYVLIPLFGTEINSQGMRVYSPDGLAITQSSGGGGLGGKTGLYFIDYRIRRLTPKEVFRLMGYSDQFFEICQALNSDTQLYKQGGNSIVVDTIMWLLVEVCQSLKIPFTMPFKS